MEKAGQSSWSLGNREVFLALLPTLNPKVNIRKTAAFAAALTYLTFYIIPIPGFAAGTASSGAGLSATALSVVRRVDATEAAF